MELGRCALHCCNAFRSERCLSTINSSWNVEHEAACACVSCQMWKRCFSPCADNEATEAREQAGKCTHACTCVPPCVCAGLEGQMPAWNSISVLIIDKRLSSVPSLPDSPQKESHPLWWSEGVKKKTKSIAQIKACFLEQSHAEVFEDFWRKIIHVRL